MGESKDASSGESHNEQKQSIIDQLDQLLERLK